MGTGPCLPGGSGLLGGESGRLWSGPQSAPGCGSCGDSEEEVSGSLVWWGPGWTAVPVRALGGQVLRDGLVREA